MKVAGDYKDPELSKKFSKALRGELRDMNKGVRPIVVVCIGTDRVTGDALGPLVGTMLSRKRKRLHVLGTVDDPVHAGNLEYTMERIKENFVDPVVVAVDSSLGETNNVGRVSFRSGSLSPGAGVGKDHLPKVGDFHFTGCVNVGGYMEHMVLANTRLSLVMGMAEQIAASIYEGLK